MAKNTKQIKSKRYKISKQHTKAVNEENVAVLNAKSTTQNTAQNEPKKAKKDKKQKKKSKSSFLSKFFKKIFNVKDNISKVTNTYKTAVNRAEKVGGWIKKAFQAKSNPIGSMPADKHLSTKDKIRKIIKEINEF